jgi:hypothetical protein
MRIGRASFSPGAVNMITQCEVAILIDAIKKQSGLDISPDAALAALYAVADYNYRLIPQKPEPNKYAFADAGGAGPEHKPTSGATANSTRGRRGRPATIISLVRARRELRQHNHDIIETSTA